MFSINPFAEISATISPAIMQWYIIVMALFVAGGTLFDVIHKGSAKYFFQDAKAKQARARKIFAPLTSHSCRCAYLCRIRHDETASGAHTYFLGFYRLHYRYHRHGVWISNTRYGDARLGTRNLVPGCRYDHGRGLLVLVFHAG